MKSGCDDNLEAKIAEQGERAKKLYRYVSDVARRVGDATTTCRSVCNLFSIQLEIQRQKLRDNCEKLLFLDPVNHGKKSLELLWRKVYYDTVSVAKKLRETDLDNDNYIFTHIVSGIGHFHHLITRIQSELKVQVKELDYIPMHYNDDAGDDGMNTSFTPSEEELQFARSALHSCLIYLGDLSRYQAEMFHGFDSSIAARYYLQAAHIDMSLGMPYNQLGNLYLDKNYNLDSVCYYIHCLSCMAPFEGATGNLSKIFEKNAQFVEILNEADSLTQSEHLQNTVASFLSLIEIWYLNKNDTNIPERCNVIAQELKIAMDFSMTPLPDINKNYSEHSQAIEDENVNPSYLNGNLMHKIVQICLFTVAKLTEIDEQKAFACKAFTLALLSQLLQKLLKQLELLGFKNPAHDYKPRITVSEIETEKNKEVVEPINGVNSDIHEHEKLTNGLHDGHEEKAVKDETLEEDGKKMENGDSKSVSKKTLAKRRRRRRVASSDSSDMSDEETETSDVETDEYCSEEEEDEGEMTESSYHSDDDSKSETSVEELNENEENKMNKEVLNGPQKADIKISKPDAKPEIHKENANSVLNENEIQNFLLGDNFLPSIKLLQDWVLAEKELILSCGDSGESLFQCVVDLLNIFTYNFNSKNSENGAVEECKILNYARKVARNLKLEYKTIPLPEDINLRGTNICKFDKDAAEWQILDRYKPSAYEENIIRILNFIDFGHQIAKIVPKIRFNRTMKIFYLKKVPRPKLNIKLNHKRTREWHNSKTQNEVVDSTDAAAGEGEGGEGAEGGGLLARLGRLWLTARVRELERSAAAAPSSAAPVLLALDAQALLLHLRKVKALLRAKHFILLVPTVVLQELDELKREQSAARDAIRWLEQQLRSGSRFLRAQRPGQSAPLPLVRLPRKAPPAAHHRLQILEFCHHFVSRDKQQGNGDHPSTKPPLLILLLGSAPGAEPEPCKEFSVSGAALAAGISLEYIGDFYSKWRQTALRAGKKR